MRDLEYQQSRMTGYLPFGSKFGLLATIASSAINMCLVALSQICNAFGSFVDETLCMIRELLRRRSGWSDTAATTHGRIGCAAACPATYL